MSFQLHITSTAEHDIMRAVDYIEFVLKNPQAADNLLDAVTKQIGTLSDFPQKFRLVDDPVLTSWEIRFVIINNYLAFYTINKEKKTVTVVRFLYKKKQLVFHSSTRIFPSLRNLFLQIPLLFLNLGKGFF